MSSANSYTTTDLVANVQLLAHVPLSNSTFTAPQIINLANRELQTALISQILSVREGYYLTYKDYDNNATGRFAIPSDAIAGALANVELYIDPSIVQVNRIEESEQFATNAPTSSSYGFFIRGNTVQILPVPSNGGSVRLWYLRRPNTLTSVGAAGRISAIAGSVITCSSLPSTMAVDEDVNLCQDQPTFDMLGARVISAISSLDVTLDAEVEDLAVGDWLCLANQTPVPQIPVEFRPLLEQRVVVKIYELQGYLDKMKAAQMKLTELEQALFKLITPRTQSQTKIVNPQNGGFLGNSRRGYFYQAGRES